tara:strand:- start:371 stop:538 length:168 start_codon:yes stop_codon:yes gene_type:complete
MSQQSKTGFGIANPVPIAPGKPVEDEIDTMPSDYQPPGTDEEREPQSLEEALLGE